jgi:translation initiation factor IF-1
MKIAPVKASVEESLPGNLYRVTLEDGRLILAHLSGKMAHNHIRVLVGDEVLVTLDPYGGKTTNRIERRI